VRGRENASASNLWSALRDLFQRALPFWGYDLAPSLAGALRS
jgi:hypothetical protein